MACWTPSSFVGLTWSLLIFLMKKHCRFNSILGVKLARRSDACVAMKSKIQLLTVDLLARVSMKNAASCDK